MKHLAKSIFTHFISFVNSQNFFVLCSLVCLLAGSLSKIGSNFKATTANLIMSKFGQACGMLPECWEVDCIIFFIRSGQNEF